MLIVAYAVRRRALSRLHVPRTYTLGRWAIPLFAVTFVWLVFALCVLTLPSDFHNADIVVAGVLVVALLWYATALRRRLKTGRAGVGRVRDDGGVAPAPGTPHVAVAVVEEQSHA